MSADDALLIARLHNALADYRERLSSAEAQRDEWRRQYDRHVTDAARGVTVGTTLDFVTSGTPLFAVDAQAHNYITQLKADLDKSHTVVTRVTSQLDELANAVKAVLPPGDNRPITHDVLISRVADLRHKNLIQFTVDERNAARERLSARDLELREIDERYRNRLNTLSHENTALNASLAALKNEYTEIMRVCDTVAVPVYCITDRVKWLAQSFRNRGERIDELTKQRDDATHELTKFRRYHSEAHAMRERLEGQLASAEERLKSRCDEIGGLNESNLARQDRINRLEEAADKQLKRLEQLNLDAVSLRSKLTSAEHTCTDYGAPPGTIAERIHFIANRRTAHHPRVTLTSHVNGADVEGTFELRDGHWVKP